MLPRKVLDGEDEYAVLTANLFRKNLRSLVMLAAKPRPIAPACLSLVAAPKPRTSSPKEGGNSRTCRPTIH